MAVEVPGVVYHVLRPQQVARTSGQGSAGAAASGGVRGRLPAGLLRLAHAARYTRAGLRRVLREIDPDIFHAHYAVEHGFYGAFAGFHPYVVSAWGSDLLVESHKPLGRQIARRTLRSADLVTANDASLAKRAAELGVADSALAVVHLGIDELFLRAGEASVNLGGTSGAFPVLISNRALEPLYNIEIILRAFAKLYARVPGARLFVAGEGSQRATLEALAGELTPPGAVRFLGQLPAEELARALAEAHVYVSVPSSDSLALSTVEAMAAGTFPVVSDLPSVDGWVTHGETGLRVKPGDADALAVALEQAVTDAELRRTAAEENRQHAASEGLREANMRLMERHYFRLAGHPQAGSGEAI